MRIGLLGRCAAAGITCFMGLASFASPAQNTSNCIWTTVNNSSVAECLSYAPPQECPNCCLHYHEPMNWKSCVNTGDLKKGTTTIKYYQATTKTCTDNVCSSGSGPAPCSHYERDCSVIDCPE